MRISQLLNTLKTKIQEYRNKRIAIKKDKEKSKLLAIEAPKEEQEEELKEEPKKEKPEERFILCIDGGGMRGIIPMIFIKKLEEEIRRCGGEDSLESYFDLVAGTSTGGLISLALTCPTSFGYKICKNAPQVNLDDILEQYMCMGKTIFPTSTFTGLRKITSTKYPAFGIEMMLDQWFGQSTLEQATVPTLIMSYDLSTGSPALLKSYENKEFLVKDAARATSAAPTYFAPLIKDGQILVDGGVIANNPALFAYIEAKKLYPNCKKFHVISFSTSGKNHTMTLEDTFGLLSWVDQVSPMYSTAQKRTVDYVLENMCDVDYTRIDEPLDIAIKMDETDPAIIKKMENFALNIAEKYSNEILSVTTMLIENKLDTNSSKESNNKSLEVFEKPL